MTDYDQIRKQRAAAKAAFQRRQKREKVLFTIVAVLLLIAAVAAIVILGGIITQFAWNVGVVALVAACGGTVGKISLGAAIAANFALSIIGGVFRRPTATKTDAKA